MPQPFIATCPAKVNLALSIGPPIAAGVSAGMHPIASWMAAVDFGDDLRIDRLADEPSRFDLTVASDGPRPTPIDWPLEKDLCFRAVALLSEHVDRPLPVALSLVKRVPTGAGLGGGSSDAAFTLVGVNAVHHLSLDDATLIQLAGRLGSDVAFFIGVARAVVTGHAHGFTSAIVTGLGDGIEPVPTAAPIDLVLIFPPFGCPTGPVYRAFDQASTAESLAGHPQTARVRELAMRTPLPADGPFNDLAQPACAVAPDLGPLMTKLRESLQVPIHVTGSGSTLFVVATDAANAKVLARQARDVTGLPTLATRTL